MTRLWIAGALPVFALLVAVPGARVYSGSEGASCTRCHEIEPQYDTWNASSHRGVRCDQCHGGALAIQNLHRLVQHLRGEIPEQIHLRNADVQAMVDRCRSCHRQEFADWQAGPHSSTYKRIFFDTKHNQKQPPADDCLRCHGMHFEGGIRDLPRAGLEERPSIPCLACHQMHRQGPPMRKNLPKEISRPSLGMFDRRTQSHVPLARLALPLMRQGGRTVKMSPDQRQALCYQCHAPQAGMQVKSGDDRTGVGVHEGISCLACHQKHGEKAAASCATCHPRLSNCGLNVEKMDTTFRSSSSAHNIHWVKCEDCHTGGVPKRRRRN
jgi:hypothetical protein